MSRFRPSAASPYLLGAGLAGVAFGAAAGTELSRTTLVEVLLVLAGGAVVGAALLLGRRGPLYGGGALLAFGALAAVTALSIGWSIAPELSYIEAGRILAYLAVFAAGIAGARLAPQGSPVVLKGILLGAMAVVSYGLASRVWPGALAENELSNRPGQPYGYWNALGTTAALAVPAILWLGSRRGGSVAGRALAYPALGLCAMTILLTQSRGALAAALLGALVWFAFVPLRLRSLPVLALPALAVAPVAAWALSKDAFTKSRQPLALKESVGGDFGLLLLLMAIVLLVAGLAVNLGLARSAPPMHVRKRVGIAAVAAACLVPLALFTSVALSDRGLGGTIGDRVDELTSETDSAPTEGAGRITAASSTRATSWREAGYVLADRPGLGTGAGTFGVARLRYRKEDFFSRHAHGFVPQTLADTGWLGLAAALALLAAWLVAAARTTGAIPRIRRFRSTMVRHDWTSERVTLVALALVPIVFGLQSAIDWTWFVPGPAVMGLVAAGFVAGRGPATSAGAAEFAPAGEWLPPAGDSPRRWPPPMPERSRALAAGGVLVCTLLFAWAVWQPEAADRAATRSLELSDSRQFAAAFEEADDAADTNPLSPRPLFVKASAQAAAGREPAAADTLQRAVLRYPGDPQTWLRLASFQLGTLDRPGAALATLRGALYLDPRSKQARALFLAARARERDLASASSRRR